MVGINKAHHLPSHFSHVRPMAIPGCLRHITRSGLCLDWTGEGKVIRRCTRQGNGKLQSRTTYHIVAQKISCWLIWEDLWRLVLFRGYAFSHIKHQAISIPFFRFWWLKLMICTIHNPARGIIVGPQWLLRAQSQEFGRTANPDHVIWIRKSNQQGKSTHFEFLSHRWRIGYVQQPRRCVRILIYVVMDHSRRRKDNTGHHSVKWDRPNPTSRLQ